MQKVFVLEKDYDHLLDMDDDASHIPFKESNFFGSRIMGIRNVELPAIIYCQANFDCIPKYDFPIVDIADSIFSDRLFAIFVKTGVAPYRSVPVTMLDDTYMADPLDKNGKPKTDIKAITSYCAIQLMAYTEAFDPANAVFDPHELFPDQVGYIKKMVLKRPQDGFPGLFRIKESPERLFVNDTAKSEIEKQGIIGCVFNEVAVSNG